LRIFFGRLSSDLFDFHTAFGRRHYGDPACSTVDQDAQIELTGDIATVLDIDPADFLAGGACLMGDQRHTDHFAGELPDFIERFRQLDASALAATAGMYLRLDDPYRTAEFFGDRNSLVGRIGDTTLGNGNAELTKQFLRLILVDIHQICPLSANPGGMYVDIANDS